MTKDEPRITQSPPGKRLRTVRGSRRLYRPPSARPLKSALRCDQGSSLRSITVEECASFNVKKRFDAFRGTESGPSLLTGSHQNENLRVYLPEPQVRVTD